MSVSPMSTAPAADLNTYEGIAEQYNVLMQSGYYDYDAYADGLAAILGDRRRVMELGVGTGLMADKLLERADFQLTGIDNTEAMMAQAVDRLGDRIRTELQDVTALDLDRTFEAAFSVGGCWYFIDDAGTLSLCSHIADPEACTRGLERVAAHVEPGGLLVFALQGPHTDYSRPMPNGMVYEQQIFAESGGRFTKRYLITRGDTVVGEQHYSYLVLPLDRTHALLGALGFEPVGRDVSGHFFSYRRG